ncbi:unnamed protein product [Phytophthora fragariaefolia]|uniref:Unnamed protein product n=1 Tax=Phytophthora fragariaefolia TaxID=1490495 RepID=A0A9W6WY83_9STRA|nr:unnamed protein product [Phytophthora fragariaefolia]
MEFLACNGCSWVSLPLATSDQGRHPAYLRFAVFKEERVSRITKSIAHLQLEQIIKAMIQHHLTKWVAKPYQRMEETYPMGYGQSKQSVQDFDERETYKGHGAGFEQWTLIFIGPIDMAKRACRFEDPKK